MQPIQPIQAPINASSSQEIIANLQEALSKLLRREMQLPPDTVPTPDGVEFRFHFVPSVATTKFLGLKRESQLYGDTTKDVVKVLQEQRQLQPTGDVDEVTAQALNEILLKLRILPPQGQTLTPLDANTNYLGSIDQKITELVKAPPLTLGILGGSVQELHAQLSSLGIELPENEKATGLFGAGTRDALLQFQAKNNLNTTGDLDDATRSVLAIEIGKLSQPRRVEGRIFLDNGLPASKLKLHIVNKGFAGNEILLGEIETDERGFYALPYTMDGAAANIEVRTFNEKNEPVKLSNPKINADHSEVINLVAPFNVVKSPANEFKLMVNDLMAVNGFNLNDLAKTKENDDVQDISLLHKATNWDARLIATAATAAQVSATTGIAHNALYGVFRAGLPIDTEALAMVNPDVFINTLKRATDAGIVAITDEQMNDHKSTFEKFKVDTLSKAILPGTLSNVGDMLAKASIAQDHKEAFQTLFLMHEDEPAALWEKAKEKGIPDTAINNLQLQGKLAYLTMNNAPLVEMLQTEIVSQDNLVQLVDKDLYQKDKWVERLNTLAGNDPEKLATLIPSTYTQKEVNIRRDVYAEDMASKVRLTYPTQVITRMVETDKLKLGAQHAELKAPVQTLLKNAVTLGFQLGSTPVDQFLKVNENTVFSGIESKPLAEAGVKLLTRVYQMTPDDDSMKIMLKLGFTSARQVSLIPKTDFVNLYWKDFNSHTVAEKVWDKSEQITSTTFNIISMGKKIDSSPPILAISGSPEKHREDKDKLNTLLKDYPTMESLFGSLDYCECEHCRSVLSPAAYLVDLLRFIDPAEQDWQQALANWKKTHNKEYTGKKPYDVLIERRPDLPHLPLTCENTNTALPYIDLVNEILEYFVANKQLDAKAVYDTGESTSAELLAEPHNIIPTAYDTLKKAYYPLSLPFDLWLETVRSFCNYYETPFSQVLDVFRPSEDLYASAVNPEVAYYRSQIFSEYLGISPAEYAIYTATSWSWGDWFKLYGYDKPENIESSVFDKSVLAELRSAKMLSQRLGISYKELVELVKTGFVNPNLSTLATLRKLDLEVVDVFRYKQKTGYPLFKEEFQFSIGLEFSAELDGGNISENLRKQFPENGAITENTQVIVIETGNKWAITEASIGYLIRKELLNLNVYFAADEVEFEKRLKQFTQKYKTSSADFDAKKWLNEAWNDNKFEKIIVLRDSDGGCNFDKTKVCYSNISDIPDDPVIPNANVSRLDYVKLNLFVRLWKRLGWTMEETDRALQVFLPSNGAMTEDNLGAAIKTALNYFSHLKQLNGSINVGKDSRIKLLSFWANLQTKGKNSLYAQLFLTRNILKDDVIFDHPLGDYLSKPDELLDKHLSALQAALNLTTDDIAQILLDGNSGDEGDVNKAKLSLANVSMLYRYSLLAKALKLSIADLITLKALSGLNPFKPLSPYVLDKIEDDFPLKHTLEFIHRVNLVKNSALSISDLDYLMRHRFDPVGKYRENSDKNITWIRTLVSELNTIAKDYSIPVDVNSITDDVLRQKMSLVFPSDVVETFMGFWLNKLKLPDGDKLKSFLDKYFNDVLKSEDFIFVDNSADDLEKNKKRLNLLNKILPFLQDKLIPIVILKTTTDQIGGDAALIKTLLTNKSTEFFLNQFKKLSQSGLTLEIFDSPNFEDEAKNKEIVQNVEVKENIDNARWQGFFEVPQNGAYRFYAKFGKNGAKVDVLVNKEAVSFNNNELSQSIELKSDTLHSLEIKASNLQKGSFELLVIGETTPKDKLSQFVLLPQTEEELDQAKSAFTQLSKSVQLIQGLGLNGRDISHILTNPNDFGDVNLNLLPVLPVKKEDAATAIKLFDAFGHLTGFAALKRDMAGGSDDLIAIFEYARLSEAKLQELYNRIASLTRRKPDSVKAVADELGMTEPQHFAEAQRMERLWQGLQVVEKFGVSMTSLKLWLTPQPDATVAMSIRNTIKSRYEQETWQHIAKSIFDPLRQRQRDGLVAYILHAKGFVSIEKLFEYFLIDPGMEPVVQTSRLRLAISSLQTFIQRCFLNLEPQVQPSMLNAKQWNWMKRYRVWEANRKIFLYPENWLEPEWRDDKTHLYQELESSLLQGDVTNQLAEDALYVYLKKLDQLARLEIVTMYAEEKAFDPSTMHVIGRTYGLPHQYFYRRYEYQMWTPWEPVNTEIEGEHIVAVMWRERLHLFWLTFMEKVEESAGGPQTEESGNLGGLELKKLVAAAATAAKGAARRILDIQLNWSEYFQGEWTVCQSSGFGNTLSFPSDRLFNASKVFITVTKEAADPLTGNDGAIWINLNDWYEEYAFVVSPKPYFRMVSKNFRPQLNSSFGLFRPTAIYSAMSQAYNRYLGKGTLSVTFVQKIVTTDGSNKSELASTQSILSKGGSFTILPCSNQMKLPNAEFAPFISPIFYADDLYTFFVEPTLTEEKLDQWVGYTITRPTQSSRVAGELVPLNISLNVALPSKYPNIEEVITQPKPNDLLARHTFKPNFDALVQHDVAVQFDGAIVGPKGIIKDVSKVQRIFNNAAINFTLNI